MELTRREVLGAVAAGSCMLSSCMRQESKTASGTGLTGAACWPYHTLDPQVTAERAYRYYNEGSCMYGVFKSIIGQLAEQHGEPYQSFPCGMMTYGSGGLAGWGSLCGALNGAGAVIGLFASGKEQRTSLVSQVLLWYEQTELPIHEPARPKLDMTMPKSVAHSVLCHLSIGAWSKASGYSAGGKERPERCARLTADTAMRTVIVLNEGLSGSIARPIRADEQVKRCTACHGRESKQRSVAAKMSCGTCHSSLPDKHPQVAMALPKPL